MQAIAAALARRRPDLAVLIAASELPTGGADDAANLDWIKLPTLRREERDRAAVPGATRDESAATWQASLSQEIIDWFSPHLLVVVGDPLAPGVRDAVLCLRAAPHATRIWYLLDAPVIRQRWDHTPDVDLLRYVYERILVLIDPRLWDLAREYNFPADLAARTIHSGFAVPRDGAADLAAMPETLARWPPDFAMNSDGVAQAVQLLSDSLPAHRAVAP